MSDVLTGRLVALTAHGLAAPIKVRFELTNHGSVDLLVLKWFTPLEGLNSDCLNVLRDGHTRVPYDGPLRKRGKPGPDDYVLVRAGETVTVDVDVSESYQVSIPAEYTIELNIRALEYRPVTPAAAGNRMLILANAPPELDAIRGGGTALAVPEGSPSILTRGEAARNEPDEQPPPDGGGATFTAAATAANPLPPNVVGGTTIRRTSVELAHKNGFQLCESALAALDNDERYEDWFGEFTDERFEDVQAVFTKVRDRMKHVVFTYDLSGEDCDDTDYAFTYKGVKKVHVCPAFWDAPANGIASKAGTIVHEHSHCDAGTDDIAYGLDDARQLAKDEPDNAIQNAENYEFYAEH
jgi:peptidyl-Lys metalloendopeptidase